MANQVKHWIQTQLFDQAPFCICVLNRDFRIIEANKQFEETYGPWEGRFCYALYKRRDSHCINCGAAETFRDGKIRVREEQGVDRDGRENLYVVHMLPLICPTGDISSFV